VFLYGQEEFHINCKHLIKSYWLPEVCAEAFGDRSAVTQTRSWGSQFHVLWTVHSPWKSCSASCLTSALPLLGGTSGGHTLKTWRKLDLRITGANSCSFNAAKWYSRGPLNVTRSYKGLPGVPTHPHFCTFITKFGLIDPLFDSTRVTSKSTNKIAIPCN
jgi:hypothetical protein